MNAQRCTYDVEVYNTREVIRGVNREELRRPLSRDTAVLYTDNGKGQGNSVVVGVPQQPKRVSEP